MSDVELRSSRSNFATCKISEAFKLHQKSTRARNSEKEERKREIILKEMGPVRIRPSSHDFGWQSSHSADLAGWQAKMASIEIWIP